MFPWSPEFVADAPHVVFLGCFYAALLVILSSAALALLRAARDADAGRAEAFAWRAEFAELPLSARRCRHELSGALKHRTCPNAFDCRVCELHPAIARRGPAPPEPPLGLEVPDDRLHHRGHAWARIEEDGTVSVGPDALARRLLGAPDALELPRPGTALAANGVALRARKGADEVRILSPVDGTVIGAQGGPDWRLRLRPPDSGLDTRHLLAGSEARAFLRRELERLQHALSPEAPALADGGVLLDDLSPVLPPERRGAVYAEIFLEA